LVADDDLVARRAITCALQTAYEKPENVESGEAALALAREEIFDVIFLDVQMPRMDGFTASARIRETGRNRTTPVVFVTGQSDFKSRAQATLSGGNDLMGKPFLTAEVTVKALTFALRGRLRKLRTGTHWLSAANEASAVEASSSGNSSDRADERRAARRRARRFKPARQSWYQSA
jgi:CheY-like chemotaxis protein